MAKAILEFDLNDPDDQMAHLRAVKSLDITLVLWEMAYNTKKSIHNQIEFDKLDAYDAVDKVFEKFHEEMNDRGINLDELIIDDIDEQVLKVPIKNANGTCFRCLKDGHYMPQCRETTDKFGKRIEEEEEEGNALDAFFKYDPMDKR